MSVRFTTRSIESPLVSLSLVILMVCIWPTNVCLAQTNSGMLFGRVRNRAGSAIEDAQIKLVNEQTGNERSIRTNADGYFTIPYLRSGFYRIITSKAGFFTKTLEHFPVQITMKTDVKLPDIMLQQATIKGTVHDRADNGLDGAQVVATALRVKARGIAVTDALGNYSITDLPPGPYIITAAWKDEAAHGLSSVPLSLDQTEVHAPPIRLKEVLRSSAHAQPAQTAGQAKSGERAAALVHTVDAERVTNFSQRELNSLPLGFNTPMRSFDELALLAPGVVPPPYTPGARGPGVGYGVGTAGQFSVNGMRARSNNFSVDGSDNNDPDVGVRRQGFVAQVPQSIESVKDFSIATLLWDTELGRNFGSQVNAVSDYGGNAFHGNLYGFFTDSSLNARNYFDYTGGPSAGEDPFTRTQLGLTFGGPIVRNRTHFFTSYERVQTSASTEQHFATPTLAERRFGVADTFGAGLFASTTIFGPFQDVTPLGRNVLSLYPLPNNPGGPYGAQTFTQVLPADGRGDIFSLKLTHQLSEDNLFSARYNFTDDRRTLPSVNRAIRSTLDARTRSHNISLILDSQLGTNLFQQMRFSFGRTRLGFEEYPGNPYVFGTSSGGSQTGQLGELLIEPFSPVGVGVETFPQRRASNTFQYADTLAYSVGGHSLKFGGNLRRYQLNSTLDRFYRPQAVYTGGITYMDARDPVLISGVQLASVGVASSLMQTITAGPPNSTTGLRFSEFHAFVNDNWRVHPRFTIDVGLRYEYNTVPREVNNRIENTLSLNALPQAGQSLFDTAARTAAFNEAVAAYRSVLGGRTRIYDPDANNFGPRLGFAWALDREGRSVLRGGYGIYFDTILGAVISQSRSVFPAEIPVNIDPAFLDFNVFNLNNPAFLSIGQDAFGNPLTLVRGGACNQFGSCNQLGGTPADYVALVGQIFIQNTSGGLAFTLPEKRLRTPYAQQWHLTFEREFFKDYYFSVAYVGTKGTKLTRLVTPNLGPYVTPTIPLVPSHGTNAGAFPFPIIASNQVTNGFTSILPTPPGDCPDALPGADPNLPFVCGDAAFFFGSRPQSALGPYRIIENSASSNYHALQVEARKRYGGSLQLSAAYTYSHAIDDVSDLFPVAGAPVIAQNSLNLRLERGDASFDVRHRFASSLIWDLPYGSGSKGLMGVLLADWQVATVFQAQTGQPFTLNLPYDANLDGNLSDRPPTTDGLIFFSGHGPTRVALAPGLQATDFLSTSTFLSRTRIVFQSGAVGRNTVRGDGLVNLDLALSKRFRFTESRALVFRTEFFNVLNRANFGLPIRVIGAPGFGSSVETIMPARVIQFALKYGF
jgi:Carboxypeptidase regulatory-like domain